MSFHPSVVLLGVAQPNYAINKKRELHPIYLPTTHPPKSPLLSSSAFSSRPLQGLGRGSHWQPWQLKKGKYFLRSGGGNPKSCRQMIRDGREVSAHLLLAGCLRSTPMEGACWKDRQPWSRGRVGARGQEDNVMTEDHNQLPGIYPYDLPDPDPATAASPEGWRV